MLASLQISTIPILPAGYLFEVLKWRSRAEVTNVVHFTALSHNPFDNTLGVSMNNFLWQKLIYYCAVLCTLFLFMGNVHPSHLPTEMGLTWAHSHWTSKFLNCVRPVFAVQTIMCSAHLSGIASQKDPHTVLYGMRVPWGKLNQRSHSCSVVPSVDKGWAVWSDRTGSMFSTDGCLPGPQFDNPAEG